MLSVAVRRMFNLSVDFIDTGGREGIETLYAEKELDGIGGKLKYSSPKSIRRFA
jgi:hypothetical protein